MVAAFRHPDFPIYLVTRLSGYDFEDVKGIIDRSLVARNRGKFVIDLKASDNTPGNAWLRDAARALPQDRVVLDASAKVLSGETEVIAYASWGSNDPDRKQRHLGFRWLPGAIMTEYVSTNGPHVPASARNVESRGKLERSQGFVRQITANINRGLHPRWRHRRVRPRVRALSRIYAASRHSAPRRIIGAAI